MKYSVLGRTGMKVSRICLGTATFGVAPTAQDADQVIGAAQDLGINFIDTADVYGNMPVFDRPGAPAAADREPAEQILGRALRGRRDNMVIATKSNGVIGHDVNQRGLSRRHIIRQVETSLRRLETDFIDLYYAHDPDPDTPLDETLAVYDDLIRQGKIRAVGLSNHPAWQLTHALWIADDRRLHAPVVAEVKYNLIDRAAERELAAACTQFGVSIVPYAPLHGGLLADLAVLSPVTNDSVSQASRTMKSRSPARSTDSATPGACTPTRCHLLGCWPARQSPQSSSARNQPTSSAPTRPPRTSTSAPSSSTRSPRSARKSQRSSTQQATGPPDTQPLEHARLSPHHQHHRRTSTMPRASQHTIDLLTDYFAGMQAKDSDRFAAYYAEDITLTFAGAPVVTGRDAVRQQMVDTLSKVESLAHPLINVWQEDNGVVIFEVDSVWTFRDGTTATITACSIFTISDDLITDQRIYVDNGPISHQLG